MVLAVLRRTWSAARECLSPDRSRRAKCLESFTDRRRRRALQAPRPQPGSAVSRFAHVSSPLPRPQLRLRLRLRRCEPSVADSVAGASHQWPRSLNLGAGRPGLLAALRSSGRDALRAVYDPAARDSAARTLTARAGLVSNPTALAARSLRCSARSRRRAPYAPKPVDIPPHTGHRVAERIAALAEPGGDPLRVAGILERTDRRPSRAPHPPPVDALPVAVWETDNRRRTDPHATSRTRDATDVNETTRTANGVSPRAYWSPSASS